jgi:hypothetical protein
MIEENAKNINDGFSKPFTTKRFSGNIKVYIKFYIK